MRSKRGITLIALIITIIVMLILVGVTINISAKGKLFEVARKASDDYEREQIRENLMWYLVEKEREGYPKTATITDDAMEKLIDIVRKTGVDGENFTVYKEEVYYNWSNVDIDTAKKLEEEYGVDALITDITGDGNLETDDQEVVLHVSVGISVLPDNLCKVNAERKENGLSLIGDLNGDGVIDMNDASVYNFYLEEDENWNPATSN